MQYTDLRDWIQKVDEMGELRRVEGVDWNLEMGAITEVYARNEPYPAILFDKIKDYPEGRRVLIGVHHMSLKRQLLTLNMPLDYDRMQFIQTCRERLNHPHNIPPEVVKTGPVMENVMEGKDIDLLSLPVPRWHEDDGGRSFPVAISFGDDPLLVMTAGKQIAWGASEYDYAGGIRGEPFDVILGKHTGLPIPASSEITI